MIILGIETATQQVGCAIGGAEGVFASFQSSRDRRHAEILTPSIEFVCKQARIDFNEISVIAVDHGPGLFTGLRVGLTTAKAMAFALRVPMLSFSSLDLLAFPMRFSGRIIIPIIDAKRREIFYARYRQSAGGVERIDDFVVGTAEQLANDLEIHREEVLLVGDGALKNASLFEKIRGVEIATHEEAFPSATALVALSQAQALREQYVQPNDISPLYLRISDAEINWDRKTALNIDSAEGAG